MEALITTPSPTEQIIGEYAVRQWTDQKGRLCAGLYRILKSGPRKGQQIPVRGSQFYFSSEEKRQAWVSKQVESCKEYLKKSQEEKEQYALSKNQPHGYEVGDILYTSWGYDQTNVDFFQVVETKEKSVIIQEIRSESVPGSEGFMCCRVRPLKDKFIGQPQLKVVQTSKYGGSKYITDRSHSLSKYTDGDKGTYCSWYA